MRKNLLNGVVTKVKFFRITIRLGLALLVTLILLLVALAGYCVAIWRTTTRIAWRAFIMFAWCRCAVLIVGARVRTSGQPPRPPFLLVANHTSYFDVILLASRLRAVFVSKADVSSWPLVGFLARFVGTLFINRGNKRDVLRINRLIEYVYDHGGGVGFFPEGTTSKGDDVQRFKPPLLDLPAKRGFPVSYATIGYSTPDGYPPAHLAICWWGGMTFIDHFLALLSLPHFDATISFGDDPVTGGERKELAMRLEEHVRAQFEPIFRSPVGDDLTVDEKAST